MQSLILTTKIQVYGIDECPNDIKNLIDHAKAASLRAYAPYSTFRVGAAILLANNQIVTGSNQENAAYPSGLCAERTALFYANSTYPNDAVLAIAVVAHHGGDFTEEICTPCGSCRQVLVEVENRFDQKVKIVMCGKEKVYVVDSIKDLLPLSFGKDALQ